MIEVDRASRDHLRAVQRRFRQLPRELKADLRKAQRTQIGTIWKAEVDKARGAGSVVHVQGVTFAAGTRVRAGLPAVLVAGASNRKMRGGAAPSDLARPMEFGTNRKEHYTRYRRRSPNGGTHVVERRASRQIRLRRRQGYIVYPAVSQTIPRLIGVWVVDGVQKSIERALEGR